MEVLLTIILKMFKALKHFGKLLELQILHNYFDLKRNQQLRTYIVRRFS